MSKELAAGLVLGAVAGAAGNALLSKAKKKKREKTAEVDNRDTTCHGISFDELIRNRTVADTLRTKSLLPWNRIQQEKYPNDELTFFLAKITDRTVDMFQLGAVPENFNRERHVIQSAVLRKNGVYIPSAIHLIAYSQLDDSLSRQLENRDYIVITEESDD